MRGTRLQFKRRKPGHDSAFKATAVKPRIGRPEKPGQIAELFRV